ncbi:MAG: ATP-binding protein, partial [Clostridia bacterium]|nr:ATP-binding protein [Clostridia bacterium]
NSEEALQIVSEALRHDDEILLVISDQKMPGKTGEKLLSEINKSLPDALKILLTGYADIEAVKYAINHAGLYRYIPKPWDREDLILTVNEAIHKYRTKKQLAEKTEQLRKMNEELEKMVEVRTNELKEALKELESFSYTVSHDLKSPLRSIDCYSKFILEDYGQELNEDVTSMLNNIREVCCNMFELIEKLLQYAVTAKTVPDLQCVDMSALISQTFKEITATAKERHIELLIDTPLPEVQGDMVLLKQVIHNLLSNAVKFTRYRENAIIHVLCVQKEKEYEFTIADNGVGFDMAYAAKLFGIFQRMHTQNEFEGSGIGLATVKKIVEKHGGRVTIEGVEDKGAKVTFTLPITPWPGL